MAYLKAIPKPTCGCGKPATVTLYNRYNARCADYCAACSKRALEKLNERETTSA